MASKYTTFISTSELASHLGDPNWIVVDCRTDLAQPEWGRQSYRDAHIPGAVYADLNQDLSDPVTSESGRHPLPGPVSIAERLGRLGIGDSMQVVAYDTASGSYAARPWCLLRLIGHRDVALLTGDFNTWKQEGLPTHFGDEQRPPANLTVGDSLLPVVDTNTLACRKGSPGYILIDARSPERYSGAQEPIDTIAGHIPGAINRFHGENLDANGLPKSAETLRGEYEQILGGLPPQQAVVYCGSGVTSCFLLVAMEHAGLHGSALYAGSWSEWISDPNRPIATGDEPK